MIVNHSNTSGLPLDHFLDTSLAVDNMVFRIMYQVESTGDVVIAADNPRTTASVSLWVTCSMKSVFFRCVITCPHVWMIF